MATNIAETSLTINGVGTVIDTGLSRVARADRLGFSQLHLERISFASSKQRAGRAGRQAPGLCYRIWSKLDENSFQPFDEAELNRIDLTDSLLELYNLGVTDPRSFEWFERPDPSRMNHALSLLEDLGAIDGAKRLTVTGKDMHRTGLPARVARMMVAARREEIPGLDRASGVTTASVLAALLSEKDFVLDSQRVADSASHECDLYVRASLLIERGSRIDRVAEKTVRRVIDMHLDRDSASVESVIAHWNDEAVAALLLKAFPDRVARRRRAKAPQARMTGGKGIELHRASSVREAEFFFALKGDAGSSRTSTDPMTTVASAISREWLEKYASSQISKRNGIVFDDDSLTAFEERATMYRDLPLESGARQKPNPESAFEFLKSEALLRRPLLMKLEPLQKLHERFAFLARSTETAALIDWTLIDNAFALAVEERVYGQTTLKGLFSEEGAEALANTWERHASGESQGLSQALRDRAPSHFKAPTGNRFLISYPEHQPPFLEVRLQELFGIAEHPKVAGQPLTFHLLGPNYRPVQVTADLPGFWKGSYFEVRKELRARYPKHSWPENPLEAPPEARGRRRF